jgi:outer membrane receptor for ferrienterochelin and colicin
MKAILTTLVFTISLMGFSQTVEKNTADVVPMNFEIQPIKNTAENAFKVFTVMPTHTAWSRQQDVYNDVRAQVPGIVITGVDEMNTSLTMRIRGGDDTMVIVDGVRYDKSILSVLNPADIESVKVSNNLGARTYFRNQ